MVNQHSRQRKWTLQFGFSSRLFVFESHTPKLPEISITSCSVARLEPGETQRISTFSLCHNSTFETPWIISSKQHAEPKALLKSLNFRYFCYFNSDSKILVQRNRPLSLRGQAELLKWVNPKPQTTTRSPAIRTSSLFINGQNCKLQRHPC